MRRAAPLFVRLASATITAAGVVLVAAGLLTVAAPASGAGASAGPSDVAVGTPVPSPSVAASGTHPSASPSAIPGTAAPTRIVMAAQHIDLPVVTTQTKFPLCNVAQFLIEPEEHLGDPGQLGSTAYIYAHARTGMFLPLLTASQTANGNRLIGDLVQVYTADDLVYTYVVRQVKRHSEDFSIASSVGANDQQLVLQTSEGPLPTLPKLQVLALFISVAPADHAAAHPTPHPVVCS
ncbi:MAG: hypothetical protein ACHQZR_04925 [Candidatus Limnocylindrales bacterium]